MHLSKTDVAKLVKSEFEPRSAKIKATVALDDYDETDDGIRINDYVVVIDKVALLEALGEAGLDGNGAIDAVYYQEYQDEIEIEVRTRQ